MASISSRPSSRMRSSTPHVKAPWAPPPCKARLMRLRFLVALRGFVPLLTTFMVCSNNGSSSRICGLLCLVPLSCQAFNDVAVAGYVL